MAVLVFTNAHLHLGGVDLSDHVRSVTLEYSSEILDGTCFSSDTTRTKVAGFLDWTLTVEFLQDYATAKVDATLYPLMGTSIAFLLKPVNAATAADNPEYQGSGFLESYPIFGGGVGEMAIATCVLRCNSVLTRDVTP